MININGMAHVILTVSQYEKAKLFYSKLLTEMGMKCVFNSNKMTYFVGGRTALGIQPCKPEFQGERFNQGRVGLHHICFRARTREDVNKSERLLRSIGAKIVTAAKEGTWAPGYYYMLCEDPDGIRVEVNFVPGEGVLAKNEEFNPGNDWKK